MITNECNWILWGTGTKGMDKVPFHFSRTRNYYFPLTNKSLMENELFSFTEINNIFDEHKNKENKYGILKGIGYHFKDSKYVGIDLDNVFHNGQIRPIFKHILKPFIGMTYIEYSPSRNGLHIFLEKDIELKQYNLKFSDLDIDKKLIGEYSDKEPGIDMYLDSKTKYFTYTGKQFQGSIMEIKAKLSDFKNIYDRLIDLKSKKAKTEEIKINKNTQSGSFKAGTLKVDCVFKYIKANVSIAQAFKFYCNLDVTYRHKHTCPLSYHRNGSKALLIYQDGYFNCQSCEKKGSIIDLVRYIKNCDGLTACKIINSDFGLNIKIN